MPSGQERTQDLPARTCPTDPTSEKFGKGGEDEGEVISYCWIYFASEPIFQCSHTKNETGLVRPGFSSMVLIQSRQ